MVQAFPWSTSQQTLPSRNWNFTKNRTGAVPRSTVEFGKKNESQMTDFTHHSDIEITYFTHHIGIEMTDFTTHSDIEITDLYWFYPP